MKGRAPIRRTLKYLNAGRLVLKDKIRIFSVAYNINGENNLGAKEFVFWYLPQIQYKNPDVQVVTLKNLTPSPFIKCYFEDGRKILVDVDNKPKEEILQHLINTVGEFQITYYTYTFQRCEYYIHNKYRYYIQAMFILIRMSEFIMNQFTNI